MANRPRTFEEVVAAQDPAEHEQRKRDERYRDRAVEQDVHADVWLVEDRNASGIWRVEYQDDNGGCYVTTFAGPVAEKRARTYFEALQGERMPTFREGARSRERKLVKLIDRPPR